MSAQPTVPTDYSPEQLRDMETRGRAQRMEDALALYAGYRKHAPKQCRDCGHEFSVPVEKVASASKWWSLCGSCLAGEFGVAAIGIRIRADLQAGRLEDWQRRTGRKHPASRVNA